MSRRASQLGRWGRGLVLVVSVELVTKLKSPERIRIGEMVGLDWRKRVIALEMRLQKCS